MAIGFRHSHELRGTGTVDHSILQANIFICAITLNRRECNTPVQETRKQKLNLRGYRRRIRSSMGFGAPEIIILAKHCPYFRIHAFLLGCQLNKLQNSTPKSNWKSTRYTYNGFRSHLARTRTTSWIQSSRRMT